MGNQSESTYSSQQDMNMHKQDLSHLRQVADLLTTGSFSLFLGSLAVTQSHAIHILNSLIFVDMQ